MPHTIRSCRHRVGMRLLCGLVLGAPLALPRAASAQAVGKEYALSELSTPVQLKSRTATARLIERAYPPKLLAAGIGGTVQVEFVVGKDGKAERETITVIAATVPQLGDAAKSIVADIDFKPGTVNGTPVRSKVVLPITFKPR